MDGIAGSDASGLEARRGALDDAVELAVGPLGDVTVTTFEPEEHPLGPVGHGAPPHGVERDGEPVGHPSLAASP